MYDLKDMDDKEMGELIQNKLRENGSSGQDFILGEYRFKKVKISFE